MNSSSSDYDTESDISSDTDDLEKSDINMVWNTNQNINFKDNRVEVGERTDYLTIESQDRFKYQFDLNSHPSDLYIRFGTVSNRTDDKKTIHTLIGNSSHVQKIYKNVKSIELVSVTIPKIMNIYNNNFLLNNTDIYIVTLKDFYNSYESNNDLIDNSFGVLRPIDRKTIEPIHIINNIDKINQGYIDLIPSNKCLKVFDNPLSTFDNLHIILKDSFNNLIYNDYVDLIPIHYLTIPDKKKMQIYFKTEDLKKENYVSNVLIGDIINISSKLAFNKVFAETILSNGMLLCFQRFISEAIYIVKNENSVNEMDPVKLNEYVTNYITNMISFPVQLKGYYSDNKSRVDDVNNNNIEILLPSYFDSTNEHLYNLITQKIYYIKNDEEDIVIQFTSVDTNEKAIVAAEAIEVDNDAVPNPNPDPLPENITDNKLIYLKAFDICLFVFEHCYEYIDTDTQTPHYELLYLHQGTNVILDNDIIVKGNYYQLKLNADNKPVDKTEVPLPGTFTFSGLGLFHKEVKAHDNIETKMRTALTNMSQKNSAEDLKKMLKFSNGKAIIKQPIINNDNRGLPQTSPTDPILGTLFTLKDDPTEVTNITWAQLYSNYITQFINELYIINNSRKYFYNFKINYLEPKNPNLTFNSN